MSKKPLFAGRGSKQDIEAGTAFQPLFDRDGLVPAIVSDASTGDVLMFAWMNETALHQTLVTGEAHFWSRSRGKLWRKGEESGNVLRVQDVLTDCDQDVILVRATPTGEGVACHTGRRSCFYRRVVDGGQTSDFRLEFKKEP